MSTPRHDHARGSRRASPMLANAVVASLIAAFSTCGIAQISNGGSAGRSDNRQSDSTPSAEPSGATVHESQKPQSKDAAKGRASTAKDHKPEGSSGFNNGLYGTGAGNNK
ncbi:beta-xylosidase [Caballeronia megalochromosomata]|jgi:hypothetical protein|nr:beta-xylosidase [Caballeronia megalochromosomata]